MKDKHAFWRSIEELENPQNLQHDLGQNSKTSVWQDFLNDPINRRQFLEIMGASFALAGLNGCLWFTPEQVIPYVKSPEDIVPGKPLFYATSHIQGGFAKGVLAETYMGRPTKIEGNPEHPGSLGGSDVFMQAFILQLYDPNRGKVPLHRGKPATWDRFYAHLVEDRFPAWDSTRGKGLRILTDSVTSPTLTELLREFLSRYPQARWLQYEPINRDNIIAGTQLAFGRSLSPVYRLDQARIILSLDADFLQWGPGSTRYAREFANQRRLRPDRPVQMNRLYIVESDFSITGASADHRLAVCPSRVETLTLLLASKLGLAIPAAYLKTITAKDDHWISSVAKDLLSNQGKSLVLAGDDQPSRVHAITHWINQKLKAITSTVFYIDALNTNPENQIQSFSQLSQDIRNGEIDSLFILNTNPVYTAPTDLNFRDLLARVPHRYCYDEYPNETSFYCDWYLPRAHGLESWGDALAFDGTITFQQPVVAPLHDGKTVIELLSALLKRPGALGRDILKAHWKNHWRSFYSEIAPDDTFEKFWKGALRDGFISNSASQAIHAQLSSHFTDLFISEGAPNTEKEELLEISFKPDPRIWDGRYRPNSWLQELPKPLTQLSWDNAAIMSPWTANLLQLKNEDGITLELRGRSVEGSVFILPGHANNVVTAYLGYGSVPLLQDGQHTNSPSILPQFGGFNAYSLRTSDHPWFDSGLRISKLNKDSPLAFTQHHHTMESKKIERNHLIVGELSEYLVDPKRIFPYSINSIKNEQPLPSLYKEFPGSPESWGMVIDLTVCIGCKTCTIACQAENNIPVVGKKEVRNHREMHWIRVDRYFYGDIENPRAAFQPVPCMHCQNAPCEYVCPTEATVHEHSGLNQMVYNRCIGTRDCSNNCPYKVRRFNFFHYSEFNNPLKRLVYNPNVTVREYGVMEKCTYCLQRISRARIESSKENRQIRAGEVRTACQAACPTQAISFGNLKNPNEEVTLLKKHPLNYGILEELGTQPRTTYLARVKNTNPDIRQR